MNAEEVLEVQQAVRRVKVDEELMNYTLAIVEKTRQHEYLSLGVSPRGSMSLYPRRPGHGRHGRPHLLHSR